MQNFVLSGKAKTVFKVIELMAKGEQVEKTEKRENKKQHK